MPSVELQQVEVRMAGRRVLGPLDLRVAPGERWMLLGPNGSGKTTLLGLIGGWRHPSRGTAKVLGRLTAEDALPAMRWTGELKSKFVDITRNHFQGSDRSLFKMIYHFYGCEGTGRMSEQRQSQFERVMKRAR